MNVPSELLDENALAIEPREVYDKAIIGYSGGGLLIYDAEKVIEAGMEIYESYEESQEWHDFNTFQAYMGEGTPIFKYEPLED